MLAFAIPTVNKKEGEEKKLKEEEDEVQGHKLTLGRVIRSPAIWWGIPYPTMHVLQETGLP